MGLLAAYSKLDTLGIALVKLDLAMSKVRQNVSARQANWAPHRKNAVRRRLGTARISEICAAFQSGVSAKSLASQYGVSSRRLNTILREEGLRPQKDRSLAPGIELRAVTLYVDHGTSIASVAEQLGLGEGRTSRILERNNVTFLGRHDWHHR